MTRFFPCPYLDPTPDLTTSFSGCSKVPCRVTFLHSGDVSLLARESRIPVLSPSAIESLLPRIRHGQSVMSCKHVKLTTGGRYAACRSTGSKRRRTSTLSRGPGVCPRSTSPAVLSGPPHRKDHGGGGDSRSFRVTPRLTWQRWNPLLGEGPLSSLLPRNCPPFLRIVPFALFAV